MNRSAFDFGLSVKVMYQYNLEFANHKPKPKYVY